jgi:hypothetical protein
MRMKEHIIQRIKINKQIVAIRVIMVADHGAKYSKQFVVNAHVMESEALNMAREYVDKANIYTVRRAGYSCRGRYRKDGARTTCTQ